MDEVSDLTPDRRAGRVALRTLRQRPAAVGRTEAGEAIYEIRSVRAVLPAGAAHFHRLVRCFKCDREVAGPALVTPADLDHPAHPMFCERCGRFPLPAPAPARPERNEAPKPPVAPPTPVAQAPVSTPAPVERELRLLSSRVAAVLEDHQSELGKLSASLTEARSEIWQLAESNRELGRVQAELNQRVVELAERVAAPAPPMTDVDAARKQAAVAEELGELRTALAGLEQRTREESAALAGTVETDRQRMPHAADARFHAIEDQLGALATVVAEIRSALADSNATEAEADRRSRSAPARGAPDLVDLLERQLLEAEGRLSRLHDGPPSSPAPEA